MHSDSQLRRVALYVGGYHKGDGTGRALRAKVDALENWPERDPLQIRVFCQSTDVADVHVSVVKDLRHLVADPYFKSADLHIFEFGWACEFVDAILCAPGVSKTLVHFHGVTPLHLVTDRLGYWATWKQQLNLLKANGVIYSSPYSGDVLARFGVRPEVMRLVPLFSAVLPPKCPVKADSGPIELLKVGRLVPHKGTLDLVQAIALIEPGLRNRLRLTIVGSREQDQDHLDEVDDVIATNGLRAQVNFVGRITDDSQLSDVYSRADALVVPSYHDTFCLPIIEAFAHGCHVIAYDNTTLPHATAGLGRIVPTGDVASLAAAIGNFVEALGGPGRIQGTRLIDTQSGPLTWGEFQQRAREIASRYSSEAFARSFREVVGQIFDAPSGPGVERPDSALIFRGPRRHVIRPRNLHLKPPFGEPGLDLIRNDRLEFDGRRFALVDEKLIFFGPYIDLSAGQWRLQLDAEIDGEFELRLTHSFGMLIKEQPVSGTTSNIEFELGECIEKFETLLFCTPRSRSLSLRAIRLDRID